MPRPTAPPVLLLLGQLGTVPDVGTYGVGIIDGNYSVDLQTGANPLNPTPLTVNASIEQNGTVPSTAESLLFEAREITPITVSFDGNVLATVALSSGTSADGLPYTLYGANISAWASVTGELEFTAVNSGDNFVVLDDISFSQIAVSPEPSPLILTGIGGLILALHRRFLSR